MLNFQLIVSKLIDEVYLFIKVYGVKGQLSILEKWVFFLDFVMQYFVDIFSEPQKSLFKNKFQELLHFQQNVTKIIDLVYFFL